ncbi:MAG: aldehyde ferredoxin oxidoreductase family protein [bacterium]
MLGYSGRILRVNLSAGKVSVDELDEGKARKFLGGRGLGARILFDEVPAGADPLGPENRLIFAMGPLAGTYAPGSGRFAVVGKSPLTGGFGEAYTGGFFAHELKYAGYDGIVVEGKSPKSVYIHIMDDKVEIRDASHIWGREVADVERTIRDELGDRDYKIASIGLAGENLVRFACIINDTDRAAGRTGLGAVMGSKNLKAIAVRGTGGVKVADPEGFRKHAITDIAKIKAHPWLGGSLSELGTSGGVEGLDEMGILPTRNWGAGTFKYANRISGTAMKNTILLGHRACQACPIGCTRVVEVKGGPFGGVRPEYGGPEYETVAALGSLCWNNNLEAIALANQMCNAYGMDTISTGSVIAFAMDCFEGGLLTEKDVGFRLAWGDPQAIVKLVGLIAKREGIGDLLAEGTRKAAQKIGGDAPKLAVEVKGLEMGMHEARGKKGLGISYATAPRGADHMEGFHDPAYTKDNAAPELGIVKGMDRFTLEGKPKAVCAVENYNSFIDSLPICSFMSLPIAGIKNTDEITGMLAAATGWNDLTFEEEIAIGERNYNLARAFTVREGGGRADDRLPWKMSKPLPEGASKDQIISQKDLAEALREYYKIRGWTKDGVPSKNKLVELGLEDVAERLHG